MVSIIHIVFDCFMTSGSMSKYPRANATEMVIYYYLSFQCVTIHTQYSLCVYVNHQILKNLSLGLLTVIVHKHRFLGCLNQRAFCYDHLYLLLL